MSTIVIIILSAAATTVFLLSKECRWLKKKTMPNAVNGHRKEAKKTEISMVNAWESDKFWLILC